MTSSLALVIVLLIGSWSKHLMEIWIFESIEGSPLVCGECVAVPLPWIA